MASVYKRASDKKRGPLGKWTIAWIDQTGKQRSQAAFTDHDKSLKLAIKCEDEAASVRLGLNESPQQIRAKGPALPVTHLVERHRLFLVGKGNTAKHCTDMARTIAQVFAAGEIETAGQINLDVVQRALDLLRQDGLSARTCNKAAAAVKAFARWMYHADLVAEPPRGLPLLRRFNEARDRRRMRRVISRADLARLFATTEQGATMVAAVGPRSGPKRRRWISGPERAIVYRLALGTGFRATEIRTLTPERFQLDGDEPTVTVLACYTKNGKEAVQPITRELAAMLRPFVAGKAHGVPFLNCPMRLADMLDYDLEMAGIASTDNQGQVLDFHALRHSYISHLAQSGTEPKVVQALARHSTITLTMDRYCQVDDSRLRSAVETAYGFAGEAVTT